MSDITNEYTFYVIRCNDESILNCYYGSTTMFRRRRDNHKSVINNVNDVQHNHPKYLFIRDHGGWDNWTMFIHYTEVCNKRDAHIIERQFIKDDVNATLNFECPILFDGRCNACRYLSGIS